MPLFKADLIIPAPKSASIYADDVDAYTDAKDIVEATSKFQKYANSKKGRVECVHVVERTVIV